MIQNLTHMNQEKLKTDQSSRFTDDFSEFWWRGVYIAGYTLFGDGTEDSFSAATDKDQLRPNFRKIKAALVDCRKTYAEELFLVQMCSFFNSTATNDLLIPKLDPSLSIGRTAISLEKEHIWILCGLMLAYRGW